MFYAKMGCLLVNFDYRLGGWVPKRSNDYVITVRKNTRYSKRKLKRKNVAKLSTIMLKGCQITKKIKSFPTEFFKNQPEGAESKMAMKGLN